MEPAWAKLNLSLDVLGARPDGFHDLRMVMQSVDLHDDVTVTLDDTGTCRAETNRSYLPCGADNVAVRAAQVFLARAGLKCGVHIRLHKRIPVCAGLGGGSSDAAAVLRALERLTCARCASSSRPPSRTSGSSRSAQASAVMFPSASAAARSWPRAAASGSRPSRPCRACRS